ncbi:MAG: membrane integrity-associated transporter subunit PqiC [Deltaproteobacteria bacterium]|nr:membrane integrity-associated transporter subunit PqiC [Deltaproteobacteria bacterium]
MMRRLAAHVLLFSLAVAGAGCASPRSSFYTLSPSAKPEAASAGYSVAVGPVSVPEIVDRPQIVVRSGPNQVSIDEFNRWASPLPEEIGRAVAGNLGSALGTAQVSVYPGPTSSGARYRVVIDVMSFDSAPGESATLDAAWVVRSAKDGPPRTGRTMASEAVPENGYPALVAAHGRALGKLSADIAGAIRELQRLR